MLSQDYLTLRLIRLKSGDWSQKQPGLSFVFPTGGAGDCSAGSLAQPLAPGDVLVFDSGIAAKLRASSGQELAFWSFSLRLEHLFPLFSGEEIPILSSIADRFKEIRRYSAASPVATKCHKLISEAPPQFNLAHRTHLLSVASIVLDEELKSAQQHRSGFVSMEDHILQVFEKLQVDEILTLSVSELADRFGCSRRHLNRLFHQHFGFSVAALRMEMRLLKAVSLLRDPEAKIINVAEQCGFNHLGLFNTCFKKRFGSSPGQWRKLDSHGENMLNHAVSESNCPLRENGLCPWTDKSQICTPVNSACLPGQKQPAGSLKHSDSANSVAETKTPVPIAVAPGKSSNLRACA